jgi:small redox-active disulfide protein 2
MNIKILGPGCPKCEQTARLVQEVVAESAVAAEVEKVKDFQEIAAHGVMVTPAVVVDGEVKVAGKVPSKAEILAWLQAAGK